MDAWIEILSVLTLEELGGERQPKAVPPGLRVQILAKVHTLVPKKKEKEAQEKELPLRTAKNLGMGQFWGLREGNDWERRRKRWEGSFQGV